MTETEYPKELDELNRNYTLRHLVLVYDRDDTSATFPDNTGYMIKTTQMPLLAIACNSIRVVGRYSPKRPHESGKTFTFKFEGPHLVMMRILKKALTPNGPKYYNLPSWVEKSAFFNQGYGLLNRPFNDICIKCWYRPGLLERPLGSIVFMENDYRFKQRSTSTTIISGHRLNYVNRIIIWLMANIYCSILIRTASNEY